MVKIRYIFFVLGTILVLSAALVIVVKFLKPAEQARSAQEGVSVLIRVPSPEVPSEEPVVPTPTPPPSGGGGGGGGGGSITRAAGIELHGWAQPRAMVTIKRDGNTAATLLADENAKFQTKITGLDSGFYDFSIFSTDNTGINSVTLNFKLEMEKNTITRLTGLYIPPTIDISEKILALREPLFVYGQTVPFAKVNLLLEPGKIEHQTPTDVDGKWSIWINTDNLKIKKYSIKPKGELTAGKESKYGMAMYFEIVPQKEIHKHADINCDGIVNITDFSILLYWWGRTDFFSAPRVDINKDGQINLIDFSIMLYWWKK
ncbi:MAG: dockerin type I repeat-containing protein [Patescibacteria group bacterium]|nr:dockerin type I repeat-containing protein [Patescibacteria group bacterium]